MEQELKNAINSLTQLLERPRFTFSNEKDLQEQIGILLASSGIENEREVHLSGRDRIDFLVGRIGVEVKTAFSVAQIIRQLARYAESDRLDALVLVTTRITHQGLPDELYGKHVSVVYLLGSIF